MSIKSISLSAIVGAGRGSVNGPDPDNGTAVAARILGA